MDINVERIQDKDKGTYWLIVHPLVMSHLGLDLVMGWNWRES